MSQDLRSAGLLLAARPAPGGIVPDADELARARARGAVLRLRRAAYVGTDHWAGLDEDARYVLVVRAAAAAQPDAVLSHWSAAALLGLPLVGRADAAVHLTHGPKGGGRSRRGVRRHQAGSVPAERRVGTLRVTSPARTLVDLACDEGLVAAVAAGDAALRLGLVTRAELAAEVAACGGRRGIRAARRAAALMDPLAESPGESLSRVRMAGLGLPMPTLQRVLLDRRGFVARVDFLWEGLGVVGEFDGRGKYGADEPGATADRVWREKRREDRIRALGLTVVRWTWADAWRAEPMARLLRSAGVR